MKTLNTLLDDFQSMEITGNTDVKVTGIAYDSRNVKPGFVFVAIRGFKQDGNQFQKQAVDAGAVAIVSENPLRDLTVTYIQVEDARIALAQLTAAFYDHPDERLHLIGITGTNGKTTTAYLIRSIFEAAGRPTGLLGTVEYIVGEERLPSTLTTPESLDLIRYLSKMSDHGQEHAVIEASSHGIVMQRTHGLHFRNVVFTNLTQDHLDFHKTEEAYLEAKTRLFTNLTSNDVAFVNADDVAGSGLRNKTDGQVRTYSLNDPSADFFAREIDTTERQRIIAVKWGSHEFEVHTKLRGRHGVYNVLTAAAIALENDVAPEQIQSGVSNLAQIPGRMEPVDGGQPFQVLVDFAHNPDALKQTLIACRELANGRVVVVFGCGGSRDPSKRPVMGRVAEQHADLIFLTSDNPRHESPEEILQQIQSGMKSPSQHRTIVDRREAIAEAMQTARAGDVILIAGKGHETYQDIGGVKRPFDDRQVVREILAELNVEA